MLKNVRDSYGGAAWCLASCPRHCFLAVGCEDGAARQFRYDGGVLEYVKSFPTTGSRILCLAYHPALPRLFMGCDDGTIRCVDEVNRAGYKFCPMYSDSLFSAIYSLLYCLPEESNNQITSFHVIFYK